MQLDDQIAKTDSYHHFYHYQSSAFQLWLAESFCAMGEWEPALAHFDKAVFQDHLNMFALYGRGYLFYRNGKSAEAWKDFSLVQKHQFSGIAYEQVTQWKAVLSPYGKHPLGQKQFCPEAGIEDSLTGDALCKTGQEHFAQGDYAKAAEHFAQAVTLSGQAHDAYHRFASQLRLQRATQFVAEGEIDLAIADCSKALDLWNENDSALLLRIELYSRKNNRELEAIDRFRLQKNSAK